MQVLIIGKIYKEQDKLCIQHLFDLLLKNEIKALVLEPYYNQIKENINLHEIAGFMAETENITHRKVDFVISLGGDGTMLFATTIVKDSGIPILGINLGRLGFLASVEIKDLEQTISNLKRGMYAIEERSLLYLESNFPIFGELRFALNDCTILKRDTSSMVRINTYINGAFLNSYWADGIIIATPTGSTGYSLSCGGPIIFPDSGCFVITPVAPHNLNVRPIVVSDSSVMSFEVEGRAETFLCTLDSRFESITTVHQLAVRKADFKIKLVQLQAHSFMQTIREKLDWGRDARN